MVSDLRGFVLALLVALGAVVGCVSVENEKGFVPPSALCSFVGGTIGMPNGPINVRPEKSYTLKGSVQLNDWFMTGLSASVMDQSLEKAAREGGLSEIYYADWSLDSYFGFVNCLDITVYGR